MLPRLLRTSFGFALILLDVLFYTKSSAQTLISQNFETASITTPPTGWTQSYLIDTSSIKWYFIDTASIIASGSDTAAHFSGKYALLENNYYCAFAADDIILESPAFDASLVDICLLEYDHQIRNWPAHKATVEVWNGTNWVVAKSYAGYYIGPAGAPKHEKIDITTLAANCATAKVRFRWKPDASSCDGRWAVDNIKIANYECQPVTASFSTVLNCDTNRYSVEVHITDLQDADSVKIIGTYGSLWARDTGTYMIGSYLPGEYETITLQHKPYGAYAWCNTVSAPLTDWCGLPNDVCASAQDISVTKSVFNVSADSAYQEVLVAPLCSGFRSPVCKDLWYKVTADNTGTLDVNVTSVVGDHVVVVYNDVCTGAFSPIACSDATFSAGGVESVSIFATAGNTYLARVFSYAETGTLFDIEIGGTALPIILVDASVKAIYQANEIKWRSLDEKNGDFYQIEYSVDGSSFAPMATQPALSTDGDYTYADVQPAANTVYYRIKVVHNDGTYFYSKVLVANNGTILQRGFSVYPVPATTSLHILLPAPTALDGLCVVTDVNGKIVHKTNVDKNARIEIADLASGIYFISYTTGNQVYRAKFIKR